jgi:hypothetical protein
MYASEKTLEAPLIPWLDWRGECTLGFKRYWRGRSHGPDRWDMKEYKLAAWPELPSPYHRTVFRRMLSDMSHRYISASGLVVSSGAPKLEVRQFLQMLDEKGLLLERESDTDSFLDSLRPVGDWFRRTIFGEDVTKL